MVQSNPIKYAGAVYLDKAVVMNPELSAMDVRVYAIYSSFEVGSEITDAEFCKYLGKDTPYAVREARKKLLEKDLVQVVPVTSKQHLIFIGNSEKPASWFLKKWEKKNK